jgi:hypothetical protein
VDCGLARQTVYLITAMNLKVKRCSIAVIGVYLTHIDETVHPETKPLLGILLGLISKFSVYLSRL